MHSWRQNETSRRLCGILNHKRRPGLQVVRARRLLPTTRVDNTHRLFCRQTDVRVSSTTQVSLKASHGNVYVMASGSQRPARGVRQSEKSVRSVCPKLTWR
eukprot:181048-Pleurochrysis_carterae.AAC.1